MDQETNVAELHKWLDVYSRRLVASKRNIQALREENQALRKALKNSVFRPFAEEVAE